MRVDKWLWAARFLKTRALASHACELGRIECNGQAVKASREIRSGDRMRVKTEAGTFDIEVLILSAMRGPAPVAQTLYRETEASRELRARIAEEPRDNRPSKRDRRERDRFRGRGA